MRTVAMALACAVAWTVAAQEGAIRVNCGGQAVTNWAADAGFTGGASSRCKNAIAKAGAVPPLVYRTRRMGPSITYAFPDVPDGACRIRLHFADWLPTAKAQKVFDIKINGALAYPNLDVFAKAGVRTALRLDFHTFVKDGEGLTLQAIGKKGKNAFLNGIEIFPVVLPGPDAGMAWIPPGTNTGVNPPSYPDQDYGPWYPRNYALVSPGYGMDRTEVTAWKWEQVREWAATNGYSDLPVRDYLETNTPVIYVSWFDCVKWCNARSEMEGRIPAYYTDATQAEVYREGEPDLDDACVLWNAGYRLPTNKEWEYAARGGARETLFPWGNTIALTRACYNFNDFGWDTRPPAYERSPVRPIELPWGFAPCPVGSYGAYGFGLYDMIGNVTEWCWDQGWEDEWARAVKGGDWLHGAYKALLPRRMSFSPDLGDDYTGFRTVLPAR